MKVAIIPADESKPVEYTDIPNTLQAKQKIVDGLIECGRLVTNAHGSLKMDVYWNEEYLYREEFELNRRATLLYLMSFMVMNPIYGDVVAIGGIDRSGKDVDLTAEQEAHLRALFPDPVAEPTC